MTRLCGQAALADDLAQETFMRAYNARHQVQKSSSARSWLYQIAYRTFLDYARKNKRRRTLSEAQIEVEVVAPSPGLAVDIEKAMQSLTTECRAVVMLSLAQGLSHHEVAKVTGLPLGTVKSHVRRGKDKLQKFLVAYAVTR